MNVQGPLSEQEITIAGLGATLVEPAAPARATAVVLGGSDASRDLAVARFLAAAGARCFCPTWFGGPGQSPGICEIPLDGLLALINEAQTAGQMPPGHPRSAVVGWSKGAEAALLLGTIHKGLDAVIALAPTHLTWANLGPGEDGVSYPFRSSWLFRGTPVPFLGYDTSWSVDEPGTCLRDLYERSEALDPDGAAAARIPVGRIRAELILVAGGADRVWPADASARIISAARPASLHTVVVSRSDAGHRPLLPGDGAKGNTADRLLGDAAATVILQALDLT